MDEHHNQRGASKQQTARQQQSSDANSANNNAGDAERPTVRILQRPSTPTIGDNDFDEEDNTAGMRTTPFAETCLQRVNALV